MIPIKTKEDESKSTKNITIKAIVFPTLTTLPGIEVLLTFPVEVVGILSAVHAVNEAQDTEQCYA